MRKEIVLDLETKKAPESFGGRDLTTLGISVVGTWLSGANEFRAFREHEFKELGELLKNADLVIGFFITKFDLPVLQPYLDFNVNELPVLDIFDDVVEKLGHRVSLASLSKATLNASKSGHGLDAITWYHEGNWERLIEYCIQDVRLTRDLYTYGQKNGHLLFESFVDNKTVSVPVSWGMPDEGEIRGLITKAHEDRRVVEIDYVSRENAGDGFKKTRKIEVQNVNGDEITAYDHLRDDVRGFRIGRILAAQILNEPTKERMVAQSLFG